MQYQINEEDKEITFFVTSLPIQEIEKFLNKFEKLYSDVRSWKIAFKTKSDTFIIPAAIEASAYVQDATAPEKPEVPEFNYKENTLPKGENK